MVQGTIADYVTLSNADAVNVGIDMGNRSWVLAVLFYRTGDLRHYSYKGKDCQERGFKKIDELVAAGHAVHVTYEIGRDGFAPARVLRQRCGVEVTIVPVNRLEVVSSGKRVKTDRIDAAFLAELDPRVKPKLPAVWTPSPEAESRRRALREKQRLRTNIGRLNNQIISVLKRWPMPQLDEHRPASCWAELLQQWDADPKSPLPRMERLIIANMVIELEVLEENLQRWETTLQQEEERHSEQAHRESRHTIFELLRQFRGVGDEISRNFDWYLVDLDRFRNGGALASYLGLTPTPHASGNTQHEQGISKKGNKELRRLMVQLAWLWVQWQPDSALARKWQPQLQQRGRQRKTAIVALARQLAVAFYRFIVYGEEIEGATRNTPLPELSPAPPGGTAPTSRRTMTQPRPS